MKRTTKQWLTALVSGLLFGSGLVVGGMTDPRKVIAFLDVGGRWDSRLPGQPSFILGYALGSGDKNPQRGSDRAFRQTGLQANDEEFRTYGELLRPELSNLSIPTLAVQFPIFWKSHIEFAYRHFRQVYPAPFLRDARIEALTRVAVAASNAVQQLQRERGMSVEDADRLLQGFERSPDLDPFVQSRGEEIGVGVERAGAFLASASREAGQIQRLYCSGGGARIPGLADTLGQRLRLPVEVADPLKGLRVKDGAFGSLAVDEVAPLLMLAVGLALRKLN